MKDNMLQRCNVRVVSRHMGVVALGSACLALACGSEQLSLGEGEAPLEPGEPACGGGVVQGSVEVNNQLELDELAGCEEVVGNLWIHAFAGADLRPLSALRIVRGNLAVGPNDSGLDLIESLEGLEALEQVSALSIHLLGATDLAPLSNLRRVQLDPRRPFDDGGFIEISGCPNLIDLTGLDGLEQWDALLVDGNPSIQSLNGLGLPRGMPEIQALSLPALRDVSALAALESAALIHFWHTGLERVTPLRMKFLRSLNLEGNDALVDIDGFASLGNLGSLEVRHNPALTHLPEWPELGILADVQIVDNAELRSIPPYATIATPGAYSLGVNGDPGSYPDLLLSLDFTMFEVGQNPKVTSLTLPAGLERGRYIGIYDNASLTSLNLGAVTQLDQLSIRNNATLASVTLGGLDAVDALAVENNPLLPSDTFADLPSFERVINGNAGDPP